MRIILAIGVLLGGVAVALLFRHPPRPGDPPKPGVAEHLVLRKEVGPAPEDGTGSRAPHTGWQGTAEAATEPAKAEPKAPKILVPAASATQWPRNERRETLRRGTSVGIGLPTSIAPNATPRVHRIVDGDTLEILAQRYLGRADRAADIFEANRDRLSQPDLLPIGLELNLPPRHSRDGVGTLIAL